MIEYIGLILTMISFACLYRLRGGAFSTITENYTDSRFRLGTTSTRIIFWTLPIVILVWLSGFVWWVALLVGVFAFFGITQGHGLYQDIGRNDQINGTKYQMAKDKLNNTLKYRIFRGNEAFAPWVPTYTSDSPAWHRITVDMVGMSSVHAVRALLIALPLTYFSSISMLLLVPIAALSSVAYFIGWYVPINVPLFLQKNNTEWGEFLTGAIWGIGLYTILT